MGAQPFVELTLPSPSFSLTHGLAQHYDHLGRFGRRRALERDDMYRKLQPDIRRVLEGCEWDLTACAPSTRRAPWRAVAWNVERGKRFDQLMTRLRVEPAMRDADLMLVTELDIGMGRSGNRNVPKAMAGALGMGYVFANYHLVLAPGDSAEQDAELPNELALHGAALLSRHPIKRAWTVELPELVDKFHVIEKRLGTKRALLCEVAMPDGPLLVAVLHLDPFASSAHRAMQMRLVTAAIDATGIDRVLLGGDLNTNTYDLGSKLGLTKNVLHKLFRFGFAGTVRQYMTPEQVFERPLFEAIARAGFVTDGFTDPHAGTIAYDLNDPEVREKSLQYLPMWAFKWLERKLGPWNGCVPMRLDHFAGRGLVPVRASTLPRDYEGERVSDHSPIVLEFTSEG
ncbi:MAG TPA: endonuclease/exonuclease/phosphatase family protein [Nannocystaceae bacterium]|nr:endonuclease/exonuclease/phosphatase family protein [Nannocystaceae bacterium]